MYDVIKIRLKRRIVTGSEKGNQQLNIKTAVERPILKLGTSHLTLSSATALGCFVGRDVWVKNRLHEMYPSMCLGGERGS